MAENTRGENTDAARSNDSNLSNPQNQPAGSPSTGSQSGAAASQPPATDSQHGVGMGTKRSVTGSDTDGQVSGS